METSGASARRPAVPSAPDVAYERTSRTVVRLVDPDRFEITASLADDTYAPGGYQTVHDMTVVAELRCADLEITAVRAGMASHPHGACPATAAALDAVVGLRVAPGFFSELRRRVGGDRSCNHLHTLVQNLATVAALSYAARLSMLEPELQQAAPDDFFGVVRDREPGVVGSCHVWREGGQLVERLDRRPRR